MCILKCRECGHEWRRCFGRMELIIYSNCGLKNNVLVYIECEQYRKMRLR